MRVYLDHAATTPLRPEAKQVYLDHLELVGNPSAVHGFGQGARRLVEDAREKLAQAVGAHRSEIIFTSGGTEGDNLAIKGLYWARRDQDSARTVIISAATEHHAVIDSVEWLEKAQGAEIVWLPVDRNGVFDLNWLSDYLVENHHRVALITLMWANNESGVVNDIPAFASLAAEFEIPMHSDAVAAFGHIPIDFAPSNLSALTFTAHKVGGPVGIGALVVRRGTKITAVNHGGGHEFGYRSGTLDAVGASAFAKAAEISIATLEAKAQRLSVLRDRIVATVAQLAPEAELSRGDAPGLPDNAHFVFPGCSGDSLLFLLDRAGISVSNGSACQAGVAQGSHVLIGMGYSNIDAASAVRITLGYSTTEAEIDALLEALPAAYSGAKKAGLTVY